MLRFTASTIMTVVYGYEMAPRNDLFASIADRASEMLTNSFFPGAALVNAFPACQCSPRLINGCDLTCFQYNTCPNGVPVRGSKSLRANAGSSPGSCATSRMHSCRGKW